jgi:hypothetical protein
VLGGTLSGYAAFTPCKESSHMQRHLQSWIGCFLRRRAIGRAHPVRRQPRTLLRLERLEDRTVPAIFIVNTLTDTAAGTGNAGSLRYCITEANQSAGNTIVFQPGLSGMITLAGLDGLPDIAQPMSIVGPGAAAVIVNGNNIADVFTIDLGKTVVLSGLTIVGGSEFYGGGISNIGVLTVSDCTIANNSTNNPNGHGAGIFNDGYGTLTIRDSIIANNTAGSFGGGIENDGTMTISDSTIANNTAGSFGGGIENRGILTVSNCTVANNATDGVGGGIDNDGTLTVSNSTVTGNSAAGPGASGGGIKTAGQAVLHDTIVAENSVLAGAIDPDFDGPVSPAVKVGGVTYTEGYNLIGDGTGSAGFTDGINGDQVGGAAGPINAELGPLQENGGPTQTMALLPGSPAVNAGDPNATDLPEFDQRGPGFARVVAGRTDIGSYESLFQPVPATMTRIGGISQNSPAAWPSARGYRR